MKNLDKLLIWLQASEYDGVILGRRDNFKWITEENANAVVTNAEVGVAHLIIEKDGTVTVAAVTARAWKQSRMHLVQREC